MSIFDDPSVQLTVDGVEVDPPTDGEEGRPVAEVTTGRSPTNWRVVARWCEDHPGKVRMVVGKAQQVTTHLRATYPHLTVRSTNRRVVEGRRAPYVDVLVCFAPEGTVDPLAGEGGVPGVELQPRGDAGGSAAAPGPHEGAL